jgi:predicted metal-dependent hydrolase
VKKSLSMAPAPERIEIRWGTRETAAELRRTQQRLLRIEVGPTGAVVVFAPSGEDVTKIGSRVSLKGAWIFRSIDRVSNRPSRTPMRRFVSGETHLFLGKQYKLAIEQSEEPQIRIEGSRLALFTPRGDDPAQCRSLMKEFYAVAARSVFGDRLDAMIPPFSRKGLEKPPLIVRQMSKRWGSYTPKGRIILNVDLVRASPMLIDYVICHELAHAFHSHHGKQWSSLLSTVMPDWEYRKARLETFLR